MSVTQRFSIPKVDPAAYQPMYAMEKYLHDGTLGEDLLAMVKIRASQINGCAFCLDMHHEEARKAGVDQRRLDVLSAWREAPGLYTERERAAIELAEQMTNISADGVSDRVWDAAATAFDEKELAHLMMTIAAINVWNRLAVTTHQDLPERA